VPYNGKNVTRMLRYNQGYLGTINMQVGRITSGEKGETITVICAFSPPGMYMPPVLSIKGRE